MIKINESLVIYETRRSSDTITFLRNGIVIGQTGNWMIIGRDLHSAYVNSQSLLLNLLESIVFWNRK